MMTVGVWPLLAPVYSGLIFSTACWLGVYFSSWYGPDPMILSSGCFLSAGNTFDATIAATLWVRMNGHVPSGRLRFIVTVFGSVASTSLSDPSSDAGPPGSAIL